MVTWPMMITLGKLCHILECDSLSEFIILQVVCSLVFSILSIIIAIGGGVISVCEVHYDYYDCQYYYNDYRCEIGAVSMAIDSVH